MSTHTQHPDSHEFGLADDCPRCEDHAEYPFEGLDERNLKALIARVQEDDDSARSGVEGRAMRKVERAMEQARHLYRLGWAP